MTPREVDLQRANRDLHKRLRAATRRSDALFVQLTEASRQILVLRDAAPDAARLLDVERHAADVSNTAQALVSHCGKFSRILGDAAAHGQALLDSASAAQHAPTSIITVRAAEAAGAGE